MANRLDWEETMRFGIGGPTMAFALLAATVAGAAGKGEAYPPIPDPEEVIQQCKNASLERRMTPNTSAMRSGNEITNSCLADAIKENLQILIGSDHFYKTHAFNDEQTLVDFFEDLEKRLKRFYAAMHFAPQACSPRCGTENNVLLPADIGNIYEEMLRDVIHKRKRHGT